MRREAVSIVFLLFCGIFISGHANDEELPVRLGVRKFGQDFYNQLADNTDGNIVFSPFSAHAVLSMLYAGAGGTTKEALGKALYSDNPEVLADGYDTVLQEFSHDSASNFELSVANKVYVKPDHDLKEQFKQICISKYHSEVGVVDFSNGAAAATEVNSWVEEKTKNKIKDLFHADDFTTDTHGVLLNSVYLKGEWWKTFSPSGTQESNFHVNEEIVVKVPMMYTGGRFDYKNDTEFGCEIAELPFKNKKFSMFIVLPSEETGIKELEHRLQTTDIKDLLDNLHKQRIDLSLPKFKVSQTVNMEDYLSKLNLGELFDPSQCDLTNMLENSEDMYISKAIQKTYIDVNEYGCEAASATGFVPTGRSFPIAHMKADHPFLFLVVHKSLSGERDIILFGRVANPVDGKEE